ncbi:hypothetical protein DIPPA_55382, partial [Diplonema papillatum]
MAVSSALRKVVVGVRFLALVNALEVFTITSGGSTKCTGPCTVTVPLWVAYHTVECADDAPCWIFCEGTKCERLELFCPQNSMCYIACQDHCPRLKRRGEIKSICCDDVPDCPDFCYLQQFPSPTCSIDELLSNSNAANASPGSDSCKSGGFLAPGDWCAMTTDGGNRACEVSFCNSAGNWASSTVQCPSCLWEDSGSFPDGFVQVENGSLIEVSAITSVDLVTRCSESTDLCAECLPADCCKNDCSGLGDRKTCPTEAPPTYAPSTIAPPTNAPSGAPPTLAPPTKAPPTNAPPTQAPPTTAPQTISPP